MAIPINAHGEVRQQITMATAEATAAIPTETATVTVSAPTQVSSPEYTPPPSSASLWVSLQEKLVLRLRKPKTDKKVSWDEEVVDNEFMGKKSSKCDHVLVQLLTYCDPLYHTPRLLHIPPTQTN